VDVNLVAAALLGIVYYIARQRLDGSDSFNRHYFIGCQLIFLMLLFEAATCFMNEHNAAWLIWVSNAMHVCLFALPPVLTYFWFLLAKMLTERVSVWEMKASLPHLIPIALNATAALISPFTHMYFYIDGSGVYHRGPLFLLSMVIAYAYLLIGFLMLLKRRSRLLKQEFQFLMLFSLMPMVAGILQSLVYGPLFMWAASACALVIMYLYLEERMVQTDGLTGAWTRHSFEHYVGQLLKNDSGKPFGVIYADIDDFKAINDRGGHVEGDEALKAFADIVKPILRKGDAFARMGGDEFAILVNVDSEENLIAIADRIEAALAHFNRTSGKGYAIRCSTGAELFSQSAALDVGDILRRVDRLMYHNKRVRKADTARAPAG
jgi:diguanylate cyclase (GGDEF)-like protein